MSPYIKNKKERKKIWGVGSKHGALPSKWKPCVQTTVLPKQKQTNKKKEKNSNYNDTKTKKNT
jgi:hypothetical protein